ncbi:MAG: phage tail protein [Sulfuriferula sp.]
MSSIGQAVGGIVGAVIGFYVGGPSGAVYGAQIGMMAGGLIDPPKGPVINGPRLNDLSVQTSTYGAFIPRNYGTIAQNGNVFWLQGDRLTEVKTSANSGSKGGPNSTTNSWSYFATFAVGLCEGPIDGISKIWIGPDLFYDAGSSDVSAVIASNAAAAGFTLYTGTDTQLPDPLIQADKGIANTPAYRGLAYIVFHNLALAKYSNSLMGAQVKVEIVKNGTLTTTLTSQKVTSSGGTNSTGFTVGNYLILPLAYSSDPGYSGWGSMHVYNLNDPSNPALVFASNFGDTFFSPNVNAINPTGNRIYSLDSRANGVRVTDITNPASPAKLASLSSTTGDYSNVIAVGNLYCYTAGNFNYLNVWSLDPTGDASTYLTLISKPSIPALTKTGLATNNGYLYILSSTGIYIYDEATFTLQSIALGTSISGVMFENNIMYVTGAYGFYICDVSNPSSVTILGSFASSVLSGCYHLAKHGNFIAMGNYVSSTLYIIDVSSQPSPHLLLTKAITAGSEWVNYANNYFFAYSHDSTKQTFETLFLAANIISTVSPPLSTIIQSECLTSKLLTAPDLDVTEMTDTVRGYRISATGAIRGGLDPLRAAWPFDVVQHGYQIKFKRRGSASVVTIPAGLLDARMAGDAPGVRITDSREMDLILPRKVTVKYLDVTREYNTNEQYSERLNTDAVNERIVDLPVVFNATEAAQKAESLLYLYWLERYDITIKLPQDYDNLEAGDVITVNGENATYELRLVAVNTQPSGIIECQAKYNSASIYVSAPAATGSEGSSTGSALTTAGNSTYQLLDIPLLQDTYDTAGFSVAMTGYLSTWTGGVLYRTDDNGQTWQDLQAFPPPGAVIGFATNTIAVNGGTTLDKASILAAKLYAGTLSSVTQDQMFAGQNWFAYGVDGRWEIIAAQNCILQSDGSYKISDLMRGQMGTEWATGLHVANDNLILLDITKLGFITVNSSSIGTLRNYRAITSGATLDSDTNRAFTYQGVNLECLSPCQFTGSRHPTTRDWTLSWTRRTRYAGWRDYVDAALGETTEAYEMDIYSSSAYTTVKRTLSSTTPTLTYSSANQVTDFGANQGTLYVKVYQLSSTVGRGYPLTTTITRA